MDHLLTLFIQYGLLVVYANVLIEQLGAPVPAYPTIVVAAALSGSGGPAWAAVLATAVLGALVGDAIWFAAGRRYGHRVLKTMCRVSLSPDSCVRQTESVFERIGPRALLFAKFVPGLSAVAAPLTGAMGVRFARFLAWDAAGSLLWAGSAVALGVVFQDQIDLLLQALSDMGGVALMLLGGLLALFVAFKWWERYRFRRFLEAARISVDELYGLIEGGTAPVIFDVRSRSARQLDARRIPGALPLDLEELERAIAGVAPERDVVVYCSCPNEASAVKVARLLKARGFRRVRPLTGGLDAWGAAGFGFEGKAPAARTA
ncbi:MAG TPA: DedA family protein/thiosulfate sulfurtransferase GlpE [Pelomicrobium sp.]|nr:DedA family protein/thiosulfate sulfurtransferase GlpE [Pelomicrobium sp.]